MNEKWLELFKSGDYDKLIQQIQVLDLSECKVNYMKVAMGM